MKKIALVALLAPLALGSCGLFNKAPQAVTTASGTLMDGTVKADANGSSTLTTTAWSGGAGTIALDLYDYTARKTVKEGEATLAADGKFGFASLPTPKDSELSKYEEAPSNSNCTGKFTVSDTAVRTAIANFRTDATKDVAVSLTDVSGKTVTESQLVYVDRDVTFGGQQECTTNGVKETFRYDNAKFVKGWNWGTITSTRDSSTKTNTYVFTKGVAANAKWVSLSYAPASLKAAPFNLR
ncbi:hypothetical protein [Deinococcus sp. RIT780]|uniref:hypothetical protein n=1 Tax=Deinococcus sp. RIT780 TaxID=2870472 RepID=UPI001C89345A|nr:hypothetical protein [Deinococcus sp. RIT780]MBX8465492.1 hypothetical protein [Deinococcus sp. RIT780]